MARAFNSEISHLVKDRKANNISLEAFMLGAINIVLQDDSMVNSSEKQVRLKMLKQVLKLAMIHGWAHARQYHNTIMQALEVGANDWNDNFEHLSYFSTKSANKSLDGSVVQSSTMIVS